MEKAVPMYRGGLFLEVSCLTLFVNNASQCRTEDNVLCVSCNGTFVLSPQERPVVIVLEVVGASEQQAWSDVTRNEGEVGTVVAIEYLLGTGCSHYRYEGVVVIGVTTIDPVGRTEDDVTLDDVWKIDVCKAYCGTKTKYLSASGPVAQSDGKTIRILET